MRKGVVKYIRVRIKHGVFCRIEFVQFDGEGGGRGVLTGGYCLGELNT